MDHDRQRKQEPALPPPNAAPPSTQRGAGVPAWAEKLTRVLDDAIRIPGTNLRIGLDGILGALLPGAGDALTAVGSVSLLALALKHGVPKVVLLRMLLNIGLDALIGAVPLLGDVFDIAFRANRRNLELLGPFLEQPERKASPADYALVTLALAVVALGMLLPLLVWSALIATLGRG